MNANIEHPPIYAGGFKISSGRKHTPEESVSAIRQRWELQFDEAVEAYLNVLEEIWESFRTDELRTGLFIPHVPGNETMMSTPLAAKQLECLKREAQTHPEFAESALWKSLEQGKGIRRSRWKAYVQIVHYSWDSNILSEQVAHGNVDVMAPKHSKRYALLEQAVRQLEQAANGLLDLKYAECLRVSQCSSVEAALTKYGGSEWAKHAMEHLRQGRTLRSVQKEVEAFNLLVKRFREMVQMDGRAAQIAKDNQFEFEMVDLANMQEDGWLERDILPDY
jgi:hypothetical protein